MLSGFFSMSTTPFCSRVNYVPLALYDIPLHSYRSPRKALFTQGLRFGKICLISFTFLN